MFIECLTDTYNTDEIMMDKSIHSGIPKDYYHLKNKDFGDWEIPPWEIFIFKSRLLGQGTFSKVYLAKWRETFVVAKVINDDIIKMDKELVLREIDIMTKLHHPNIVQFLGYVNEPFIIIMEYIPNKNLKDNISFLSKKQKISIMKDILQGLCYLHNRRPYSLIHRDLKLTNIILTNSKVAKIADFGLSKFNTINRILSNNSLNNLQELDFNDVNSELTKKVGTERYMAPELSLENYQYTNKIDIYSCGIMFYEMFESKTYNIKDGFKWYWTPKKIKNIINNFMLSKNPDNRLDSLLLLKMLNSVNF